MATLRDTLRPDRKRWADIDEDDGDAQMTEGQAGNRGQLEHNQDLPEQQNQQSAEPNSRQTAEAKTDEDCDWRPGSLSYLLESREEASPTELIDALGPTEPVFTPSTKPHPPRAKHSSAKGGSKGDPVKPGGKKRAKWPRGGTPPPAPPPSTAKGRVPTRQFAVTTLTDTRISGGRSHNAIFPGMAEGLALAFLSGRICSVRAIGFQRQVRNQRGKGSA